MRNLELLEQVRDKVLFEPKNHRQDYWMTYSSNVFLADNSEVSCPTTGCVAGWACQMSNDIGIVSNDEVVNHLSNDQQIVYSIFTVITPEGEVVEIEERAKDLLGLSWEEAEMLFDADNSRQDVLDMMDDLIVLAKEERNML